ncbi:MAG: proprotein convertase P-domain-containing protein, partial [Bacteroidia bacterium]|nr:proprotein convertase P-domain-containing protein [Bacteroidia bacterium]
MMKRLQFCLFLLLNFSFVSVFSQTFNGTGGGIPDNGIQTCFPVTVSGLPSALDATNGLTQVCINITHTYDADLDIFLVSPNGGALELVTDVGGANNNFQTTCFTATAATAVTAGSAPFNGTYRPEGSFANCINIGVNGNGTWYLCITDDGGGDVGTLNSWSLTFGSGGAIGTTPGCNLNAIASDVCMGAPSICTLDGYCGNTSTCFSPGQIPSGFCGSVENNGWLSFVASATSATLNITVNNCVYSDGIQMEIYGTSNCQTFTSYSNCWNPGIETNGSVTGTGLTIGQTYYLMIDGYAGDNCDYVINPGSGILTVSVTPASTTICGGSSTSLTANASGATGYLWSPGGQTTQTISVSPASTTTYTCTISGACGGSATATSTVTVNTPATVSAGADQTICSGSVVTLSGSRGGGATSSTWTTSGTGTFSNTTVVNPTYTPSAADIAAGTVTLTITTNDPAGPCPAVSDAMVLTISPAATVNAGADQTICSGSTVTLGATRGGGATSSTWSTSGTGTFSNTTVLNPTYTPSAADIAAGTVTLTITTNDPAGPCPAVSDAMVVTINIQASANAGPDQIICAGSTVSLTGTRGGSATSSTWTSSGSGTFANASATSTTYTPSAADIAAGTVTLTITTNDPAGPCPAATDNMVVTINPGATASAGSNQTICAGSTVTLTGSRGGAATSSTWTSSGTGTFANATLVNTTYTPSAADIAAGTVTLTITTNDPAGPCPAATSSLVVTINPAATANAGANASICAGSTYTLTGSIGGGASSLTWTTSGSGSFSNASATNPTYTPSASDVSAGTVTLTITTNDPAGPCPAATASMVLTINPGATANAGPAATICAGTTYSLPGSIGGSATSVTWTSSGSGTFSSTSSVTPTYTPSAADISAGSVTLTMTTNDPAGPCPAATSNMVLTINPAATVNAGADATICANQTYTLNGSRGGAATSSTWTTSGSGTFSNASAVNPVYTPSASDISAGSVTLTITSNDPAGPCPAVSDAMVLTITPLQNASFTYGSATYCQTGTNPTPTVTGVAGGTFTSSPAGLSINPSTGAINLAGSSLNTYTVTYTTPGPCANSSNVNVTITLAPTATFSYAGPYCTTDADPSPTFSGGATAGTFSSTPGLVFVNVNTGQVDVSASTPGTYTVTNTIAASGGCAPASATATITINQAATASAGSNATICAGSTYTLAGVIGGSATSLTWSTSGSGTFSSASAANATYTPSAADIAAGTVTLTITTNDPAGPCPAVTSSLVLTINPAATVNAGSNASICEGSTYTLAGVIGGSATSATWSSSGTGSFNNTTLLGAVYTPSAADIAAGSVTLTLTTNDPAGPCPAVTSTMLLTINPAATVNAGSNATICSGSTYTLAGTMGGGATSVTWSTSGTGTFSSASALNATYTPSAADIAAGTVTLTLTTNDPAGPCPAATSSMILTISPAATVSAGSNATICSGSTYTLAGTMGGGASSITWTTSGTGTFNN